ncbi:ATP-binding protein [Streptomyces sp. JW3]|uniref:ATP-binding protein n=1 Tax=Streptomyces sp. JW3 TaxID=3456955 RepID=UPI003FA4B64A
MNDDFAQVYTLRLTVGAHAARLVRRIVRSYLTEWDMPALSDTVELGVTELLANVVRHVPDRRCTVLLARRTGGVRVEVADGCPRYPVRATCVADDAEGGRGLMLLEAVADKWGVAPGPGEGKTVWFECDSG